MQPPELSQKHLNAFLQLLAVVFEAGLLKASERLVLLSMFSRKLLGIGSETTFAGWAASMGLSPRELMSALRTLRSRGFLRVLHRNDAGAPIDYDIDVAALMRLRRPEASAELDPDEYEDHFWLLDLLDEVIDALGEREQQVLGRLIEGIPPGGREGPIEVFFEDMIAAIAQPPSEILAAIRSLEGRGCLRVVCHTLKGEPLGYEIDDDALIRLQNPGG